MKLRWAILVMAILVAIAASGYWLNRPPDLHAVSCLDPVAGCRFSHGGAAARTTFSHQPTPLAPFEVRVQAAGARRISAAFRMNGMEMGFNRYDLKMKVPGLFAASVILPVCISGRHDWTMLLEIDGVRYALPFSTA